MRRERGILDEDVGGLAEQVDGVAAVLGQRARNERMDVARLELVRDRQRIDVLEEVGNGIHQRAARVAELIRVHVDGLCSHERKIPARSGERQPDSCYCSILMRTTAATARKDHATTTAIPSLTRSIHSMSRGGERAHGQSLPIFGS